MIQVQQQWHGPQVLAQIEAAGWESIQRATVYLWTKVVEALNVSNPRPYTSPSAPGEPPRKRTGWLQRNVLYELDEAQKRGRVGIGRMALYGVYLELGTRRGLAARPFLLAMVNKHRAELQKLAGG